MAIQKRNEVPIPGPSPLPVVGNLLDIDINAALESLGNLAEKYGPIYQLTFSGRKEIFINSRDLMDELCDEKRFVKTVTGALEKLRDGVGDGLFTAHDGEVNWGVAHRIIMPIFGAVKIRDMFDKMKDVAEELCLKWARYGPSHSFEASEDFTRLTLDTIALGAMDYRFNSFYRDSAMHPFVDSMVGFLRESDKQATYPPIVNDFRRKATKNYKHDISKLKEISQEIIQKRRAHPVETQDLLNALLLGRDPRTGQGLADISIINNLITFLIAGHETTSGMLSFVLYYLLKHPKEYQKAQREVDTVIGRDVIEVGHLSKLPFITAAMRETLRLMPTAPAFSVKPREDDIIGGKYAVKKGEAITLLLGQIHRDKTFWGPDADEWKPERMLEEKFENLKPNSWKPFGNGARACIGRAFAWQEAQLVIALLLQTFNITLEDPSYELRIKETLTIKPDGFRVRASLRHHENPTELSHALYSASGLAVPRTPSDRSSLTSSKSRVKAKSLSGKGMTILFGSNSGTCEALAHRMASHAGKFGFERPTVTSLDSAIGMLPSDEPVAIVTASYDGEPADNATRFVEWLRSTKKGSLEKVSYVVFGCGNRDWHATFHKIPILIDKLLEQAGAKRITAMGSSDVAVSDVFSDFEAWEENELWPNLSTNSKHGYSASIDSGVQISITHPRHITLHQNVEEGIVTYTKSLTKDGPVKKHIELLLPPELSYNAGDYLSVLPLNPWRTVQRALAVFRLAKDSVLEIESSNSTSLPLAEPISASDLLGSYVELTQPATPGDIRKLASACSNPSAKTHLLSLSTSTPSARQARASILDLLEKHKDINLTIGQFLEMLPPLRARTYSISSAPQWNPSHASLTISVLDQPSHFDASKRFLGVASNYLADLQEGDVIRVMTRPSKPAFHLPDDANDIPIIMVAAGSGLAPFRGFLQQRVLQLKAGQQLKPALLFFGCRSLELDDLYRNELDDFERKGVVTVYRAYSQTHEKLYVQDRLWICKAEVMELWDQGAKMFVCGSGNMVDGVKKVLEKFLAEGKAENGDVVGNLGSSRFVVEVFV